MLLDETKPQQKQKYTTIDTAVQPHKAGWFVSSLITLSH